MTYRIGLKFCDFSYNLLGKNFCQNFYLVLSVNYCWRHHFLTGNSCEIENSIYFDAMVEMVYFLEYFLYCKIIIRFLELFSATCFLCILQTQLVFWYFFLFWIYFSLCMQVMMYNYSLLYVFPLSSSWG